MIWSFVLAAVGVAGLRLARRKVWWAWLIGAVLHGSDRP